jgi:hypothetical protein
LVMTTQSTTCYWHKDNLYEKRGGSSTKDHHYHHGFQQHLLGPEIG